MPSKRERKLISKNRSAHHEYFIDETFECGIELSGTEVKSIRERACQITDTFALIRGGECWLVGLHIHPYSHGGVWNRDPDRRRRLLLHRKEIDYLARGRILTLFAQTINIEAQNNELSPD